MPSRILGLVCEPFTIATLPDLTKVIFKINLAFLYRDRSEYESILQLNQIKAFSIVVENCVKRHLVLNGSSGEHSC